MTDVTFTKHDADPIGTALRTRGANEFHSAMNWVEYRTRTIPTEQLPPALRMIRVLWWLEFEAGDVGRFLFSAERGFAPFVPEAAAFCRQIGAIRTAELLTGVRELFPDGMPTSYRQYVITTHERKLDAARRKLDAEFKGFAREVSAALRGWLRANREEVQRAIESATGASANESAEKTAGAGRKKAKNTALIAQSTSNLDVVLAATDPDPWQARMSFLEAATEWVWSVPGRKQIPFDSLPESARMIVLLGELVGALNSSGLHYVADWTFGDHFADMRRWIAEIHATRTGEYLDRFAALFPRKKVPRGRDVRSETFERALARREKKGLDPVRDLDAEYRETALNEIPDRLREWLILHRRRVESEQSQMAAQPAGANGDDLLLEKDDFLAALARIERYSREHANADEDQLPPSPVAVGDVVALKTKKGYAYLQVTHEHPYVAVRGPVLRVVDGLTKTKLAGVELAEHVAGSTRYFTLLWVARWLTEDSRRVSIVGRALPVPKDARSFPPFLFHWGRTRDGRTVYGQWDGGERPTRHVIAPLNEEQLAMNVARFGPDPEFLAQEIAGAWTPAKAHMGWY